MSGRKTFKFEHRSCEDSPAMSDKQEAAAIGLMVIHLGNAKAKVGVLDLELHDYSQAPRFLSDALRDYV